MRQSQWLFLGTASVLASVLACAAAPALAQETSSTATQATAPASDDDAIIVTARRQSERLQDVPASVAVLTADALQRTGAVKAEDFVKLTPGVTIVTGTAEAGDTQINIRGINGARDAESSVALVVDGILKTNTAQLNQPQGTLQQVEMLKGPQGALYGRNAAAGAVVIQTLKPTETLTGGAKLSYAEYNTLEATAHIAGPIAPDSGFVLSGYYYRTDGFYRNVLTNSKTVDDKENWAVDGRVMLGQGGPTQIDIKTRYGEFHGASLPFNAAFHLPNFGGAFYENVNIHPFNFYNNTRGALHYLLSNRTYVGEVVHNGKVWPGEHDAIVDRALFDAVQAKLATRTNQPLAPGARRCVSMLAGMIRDEQGRPMSPAHTRNHGRRYRYYASNRADDASTPALRLPAGELDSAVQAAFVELLQNAHQLIEVGSHLPPHDQQMLVEASSNLATRLGTMSVAAVRALLLDARLEVVLSYRGAAATISAARLLERLGVAADHDHPLPLPILAAPDFRGHEPRLRLQPPAGSPTGDPALMQIIASGFAARNQLLAMTDDDVATTSGTRVRHLIRYARLAYLAPDIIRSIMEGRQPRQLTARYLVRCPALPLDWAEQRRMLGFPAN